jgi:transposase
VTRPPSIPEDLWATFPPAARAIITAQADQIRQLDAVVNRLLTRVAALEAQLGQNSTNSSKPPSSDPPHVKPAPPKPPSGRKRGGQPGHPPHPRAILPPDRVIEHKPAHCRACRHRLAGDDPAPVIDQVVDLSAVLRCVTHHRRHTLTCPHCHTATTAAPVPDAATGYGPRVQAAAAYLSAAGRLGKRAVRQFLADVCGIPISLGTVSHLEGRTSRALEPVHAAALAATRTQDANVDETGWREGAAKAWLWVAVTPLVTAFLIRPHRNRAAFDDLRGGATTIHTTDRFTVYDHFDPGRRQVCWAHLRRDFQAMIDRRNAGSPIGEELLAHADILFAHWKRIRDGTITRRTFRRSYLPTLRGEVHHLLTRGAASACAKTAAVCRAVRAVEAGLWTFATAPGVEPTNNAAERAIRHAVCWRKTSYGTDSARGSRFAERMLTVIASCRSQGRSILDFLAAAIAAAQHGRPAPSLIPAVG